MQSVIPSLRLFKPTDDIYDVCESPIFNLMWQSMIIWCEKNLYSWWSMVTVVILMILQQYITTVVIVVTVETLVAVLSDSRDISDKSDIVDTRDSKNRGDTSDNRHIS